MAITSSKKQSKKKASRSSSASKGAATRKKKKKTKKKATSSSKKTSAKSSKSTKGRSTGPKTTIKALVSVVVEQETSITKGSKYRKDMDEIALNHCSTGGRIKHLASLLGVSKATIMRWRNEHETLDASITRGQALWLNTLPDKLIEHLSKGKRYQSFAGTINRSKGFLYALESAWEDFREAKEIGLAKSLNAWEEAELRQVYGQMTLNLGQIPLMGNGEMIKDENGKPIMIDKIIPARFSERALIFGMQNRFDECKPDKDNTNDELLDDLRDAIAEVNGENDGQEMDDSAEDIG